jgi:hypothetical protein
VLINDRDLQRHVAVCLSAFKQVLDMYVRVWKRISAEDDVICLPQRDIRSVPDGAKDTLLRSL